MGKLLADPSPMELPPTDTIVQTIQKIGGTQSIVHLVPFYTRLLESTRIHPELVSAMLDTVTDLASEKRLCAPVAPMLEDLYVRLDTYLREPESESLVRDAYLRLTGTLIEDPYQTCIGYRNSSRYIRGGQLDRLRNAVMAQDTRRVTDKLVDFWRYDGEYADDETITVTYHLWSPIAEQYSESVTMPLPIGFEDASRAFPYHENRSRPLDRQKTDRDVLQTHTALGKVCHFVNVRNVYRYPSASSGSSATTVLNLE